jgi:hypothetical protein
MAGVPIKEEESVCTKIWGTATTRAPSLGISHYKQKVITPKNTETFTPWFGTPVCTALGILSFSQPPATRKGCCSQKL